MRPGLSILVDLDGIVADLHPAWRERALACCPDGPLLPPQPPSTWATAKDHAEERARRVASAVAGGPSLEQVLATYNGWTALPCGEHVFDHLDHNLFDGLDPLPGAVEALRQLDDAGHEVTIVTASASDPQTAAAKLSWVERVLGWGRHSVIVAQRKHLVRGDVFIDDAPKNLAAWQAAHPTGLAMTIAYPYNAGVPATVFRAESWRDPAAAWAAMVARIARRDPR